MSSYVFYVAILYNGKIIFIWQNHNVFHCLLLLGHWLVIVILHWLSVWEPREACRCSLFVYQPEPELGNAFQAKKLPFAVQLCVTQVWNINLCSLTSRRDWKSIKGGLLNGIELDTVWWMRKSILVTHSNKHHAEFWYAKIYFTSSFSGKYIENEIINTKIYFEA